MLVKSLQPEESIRVAQTVVKNITGRKVLLGIEGPDVVVNVEERLNENGSASYQRPSDGAAGVEDKSE